LTSLREDAVAGVVVGVIALPLSIALAVAVGVPPVAGLYTAIFAGAVAALLGGSDFNITGPTAALVPVLSHAVLVHGASSLPMIGLMAGVILIIMSVLNVGRLIRFMPGPVIVGFTAGIALSIAFGQLNNLVGVTGTDPSLEYFHERTWDTIRHLRSVGVATPLVGIASLVVLIFWSRAGSVNRMPAPLAAVVLITLWTWAFGVHTPTIGGAYGEIPRDLPSPSLAFIDPGLIVALLPTAVAVAVLGSVESLLSAVVADGMSPTPARHDPDRELFGQGAANLISPIMGGIPATAAIARTAAGIGAGGRSRATGVFHALTVLAATMLLGGYASHIPLATLAAILLVVAWNIAEVPELLRLTRRAPREDLIVLLSTVVITVFFDLTYAIGFGVLASAVLLLRRLVQLPSAEQLLPDESGRIQRVSPELSQLMQTRPDIAFFTAQGMLSFHSVAAFEYELSRDLRSPLILRMKDVHHVDTSGLLTLEGVIQHRQKHGGRIILTAVQPDLYSVLERFGIIEQLGAENLFEHTRCAIDSIDLPAGHEVRPSTSLDAATG
jgi:SulP family sulfate permease